MNILGYEITELKCTCWSDPSQWEAKNDDGNVLLVRYRHGLLSVQLLVTEGDDTVGTGDYLYEELQDGDYEKAGTGDGFMTEAHMLRLLSEPVGMPELTDGQINDIAKSLRIDR